MLLIKSHTRRAHVNSIKQKPIKLKPQNIFLYGFSVSRKAQTIRNKALLLKKIRKLFCPCRVPAQHVSLGSRKKNDVLDMYIEDQVSLLIIPYGLDLAIF
jgi:hypothetical protein